MVEPTTTARAAWRACYYCGLPTMYRLTTTTRVYGVCESHRDIPRRDPYLRVARLARDLEGRAKPS